MTEHLRIRYLPEVDALRKGGGHISHRCRLKVETRRARSSLSREGFIHRGCPCAIGPARQQKVPSADVKTMTAGSPDLTVSLRVAIIPVSVHAQDARTRYMCAPQAGDFASASGIIAFRRCLNQHASSARRRNARGPARVPPSRSPPPQPPAGNGAQPQLSREIARRGVPLPGGGSQPVCSRWRWRCGARPSAARMARSFSDGVASFRALDATMLYTLDPLGRLWQGERRRSRQAIDTGVAAFQPLDRGTVIALGQDGRLQRITGNSNDKTLIDSEVAAFPGGRGCRHDLCSQQGQQALARERQQRRPQMDQLQRRGVRCASGEATVFVLTTGSELWRKTADEQPVKISGDARAPLRLPVPRWVYVT